MIALKRCEISVRSLDIRGFGVFSEQVIPLGECVSNAFFDLSASATVSFKQVVNADESKRDKEY